MFDRLAQATARLLGRSAYAPPIAAPSASGAADLDSPEVEQRRRQMGGQIQPVIFSQQRWYLSDIEGACMMADGGLLAQAARLWRAARGDGIIAGVLSTATDGLVRLPKRFIGDPDVIEALELGHDKTRSVFDEMFPPAELALMAADGIGLGIGVAELVPVEGRDYPVMVRLDPEFLVYRWFENAWFFRSSAGLLRITPGDGRWILHVPGGRMTPWQHGIFRAIAREFIRKEHASLLKDNWERVLANPARAAVSPQGAGEAQADTWFQRVMAWGVNTVFGMRPGYDVKLIESNGRGWECFTKTIEQCNTSAIICIAGQTVTTDGGAGFQNSDIHKTIRADKIKAVADALSYTINTQGIPAFIAARFGIEAIETKATVQEWDVTPPKDRNSEAQSIVTTASAIKTMSEALKAEGLDLDVPTLCRRFAIPLRGDANADGVQDANAGSPPKLRLIAGGAGATGDATDPVAQPSDHQEQDTSLNGAQVTSMLEIVQAVAAGTLPRDAAKAMLKRAFRVDDAGAEELLGSAGAGFVPAAAPAAPAAPAPKPDEVAA